MKGIRDAGSIQHNMLKAFERHFESRRHALLLIIVLNISELTFESTRHFSEISISV